MEQTNKLWSPTEVRKTITLIFGGLISIYGIYLIGHQLTSTGTVTFDFKIFSGTVSSGDAGIIVFVLGVMLMIISSLTPKTKESSNIRLEFLKDRKTIGLICSFVLLLVTLIIFVVSHNIYIFLLCILLLTLFERIYHSK